MPAAPQDYSSKTPLGTGDPVRLTYNPGADERATWLPDGSAFLYTAEHLDSPERDRCLEQMAATGGAVSREICADPLTSPDSQNTFASAAVAPDGRMAYVRTSSRFSPMPAGFNHAALVLASIARPLDATVLEPLAFFGPNGRTVSMVTSIHWVGANALIFLGERLAYESPCGSCRPDTLRWGLEIDRLYLGAGGHVDSVTAVPGTDGASSLAYAGGDTIYFTRNGESRIYRQLLTQGIAAVVHDFGALTRDVGVAGARFTAVVGGSYTYGFDTAQNAFVQRDHGGDLRIFDLLDGETIVHLPEAYLRRPVSSPGGGVMVFEVYPYAVDTIFSTDPRNFGAIVAIDTTFSRVADLWRLGSR